LWQGKLAQAAGQAITATLFFSRAAAFDPTSYYGIRAAELVRGEAAPLRAVPATVTFDEPAQRAAAEVWLAARLNMTDTTLLRGLRGDLAADPALQRGLELNKLGLQTEAADELDAVRRAHPSDAVALYQLAILLRDARLYRPSLAAADALLRAVGVQVTDAPPFWRAWCFCVLCRSHRRSTSKGSWIRCSFWRSSARKACLKAIRFLPRLRDLMQIIPSTGQEIATALKWADYSQSDLYKPYINVKFGVYYLARQREGFEGDLYAALAAYNGGPGNAARWKAASGGDPDLFYETISLWETQLYIRRVSEYYVIYQKLYAAR
jgi:soluble lytic murein transglycosylase